MYIQLISVHGLIRAEPELGRDPDTGGQIKYVLELACALAAHEDVDRVDLLTRRVCDANVGEEYSVREEALAPGAWLIRCDCGPARYIRKEKLWPYLDCFADQVLQHMRRIGRIPELIHTHYADAGYVGCLLSGELGIPLVHTGHSLGRVKELRLRESGASRESIEKRYNMQQRIEAEERLLDNAALVIASTRQEIDEQYGFYDNHHPERMRVIPPGVALDRFHRPGRSESGSAIEESIDRFLSEPRKPLILALSRPDPRKNVGALLRAYGESPKLQSLANLAVILGNRDDIAEMPSEPRGVLEELLRNIDHYDLYGKVAYPKHHEPDDVPVLYRLAARRRGVFVNPALTEPFGLTLIEAAASGLPIVATHDGGPRDIIGNCKNGLLIDPLDHRAIERALLDALSDRGRWSAWARNGTRGAERHYSWPGHVSKYLSEARKLVNKKSRSNVGKLERNPLPLAERLIVSDIDNTLLGDRDALAELLVRLESYRGRHRDRLGIGIATGRSIESARKILREWKVPAPDVWITSVGSEIHYGKNLTFDSSWERHIEYRWNACEIRDAMREIRGVVLQPDENQRKHKVSFDVDPDVMPSTRDIARHLRKRGLEVNLIYSHAAYLDVLPVRASKGKALRHIAMKWGLPLESFLVAGDSGNDEEMLRGETLAVVVGNHSSELAKLRGEPAIYFAEGAYARGILEALDHYRFLESPDPEVEPRTEDAEDVEEPACGREPRARMDRVT